MTDRHALPRAAGSIRLIGVKKNHRLSRWVAFYAQLFPHLELGLLILYDICNINLGECSIFRRDSSQSFYIVLHQLLLSYLRNPI